MSSSLARCRIPVGLPLGLRELGVSEAAVLREAKLPADVLRRAGWRVSVSDYFALWSAIDRVAEDPNVGLRLGAGLTPDALEPAFIAALGSRSFGDALARIARYKQLTCPERVIVRRSSSRVVVRYLWPGVRQRPPDALVDAELAFLLNLGSTGARQRIRATRARLRRPQLPRGARHRELLGGAVVVGAEHDELELSPELLELAFGSFNPGLLELLEPQLEAAVSKLEHELHPHARVREVVREVLVSELANARPGIDVVAQRLGLSARTLQRQLAESGTSFRAVVSDTRRELALFYLRESELNAAEIAALLGFGDANSFYRAFRTWTGATPQHVRGVLRKSIGATRD